MTPAILDLVHKISIDPVQVTLLEPQSGTFSSTGDAPQDRRVGVAAPKMFAFDAIYTDDDAQVRYICGVLPSPGWGPPTPQRLTGCASGCSPRCVAAPSRTSCTRCSTATTACSSASVTHGKVGHFFIHLKKKRKCFGVALKTMRYD